MNGSLHEVISFIREIDLPRNRGDIVVQPALISIMRQVVTLYLRVLNPWFVRESPLVCPGVDLRV